jgi:hypothetical protein
MPELLKNQVARLLDHLTRVSSPSRRDINRCLALMRPYLLAAEATPEDIDRFVIRVHEALREGEVLMRLACGREVRKTIERMLELELGLSMKPSGPDWLTRIAGPNAAETKWCLKELDAHTRNSTRRRRYDLHDRRLPRGHDIEMKPFTPGAPQHHADQHPHDLDRDAVDRLLRQLGWGGRDFGPEPPTGGSPARV